MLQNSFGVRLSYASVDRGDGSDPRPAVREILSELRVPAGLRDATAEWEEAAEEAVISIPVTDDGRVLTLSAEDRIESVLIAGELRTVFQERGLTLWLETDLDAEMDEESVESLDDRGEPLDEEDEESDLVIDPELFGTFAVRVSAFSHRGPAIARVLATARHTTVAHWESGEWSLQQFESSEPTGDWTTSRAELPVVELNRTESSAWFEVTAGKGGPVPFWPEAERDTRAVLDIDAIRVPETAEIYRRLLAEGDGSKDELLDIAASVELDVEAAHRALMPEALGGVVGAEARQRAFVAAFGVAPDLIDAAFDADGGGAERRFLPVGWWTALRETAIAGMAELTPITRRQRPLARLDEALRRRPLLGFALTTGELVAGLWATSRLRRGGRFLGVLLIIDAAIDAAIWIARIRGGRR